MVQMLVSLSAWASSWVTQLVKLGRRMGTLREEEMVLPLVSLLDQQLLRNLASALA